MGAGGDPIGPLVLEEGDDMYPPSCQARVLRRRISFTTRAPKARLREMKTARTAPATTRKFRLRLTNASRRRKKNRLMPGPGRIDRSAHPRDDARSECDDPALHGIDDGEVVRGHDDGGAGAIDPVEELHDPDRRLGIEVSRRLVGEHDRRAD